MNTQVPELSIVLATTHDWPAVRPTLDAIFAAEAPAAMEVILCEGSGSGGPPADGYDSRLRVVSMPGEPVFDLRARGVGLAGGEIVAITEDHCLPAPDWPVELSAAHRRHPTAVAISGAVTNGSTEDAWDWANFLMTFAEHMPPMSSSNGGARAPSVANGSVKRVAAHIPRSPAPGWFELELMPSLLSAGKVARDDGPRVAHIQSHGGRLATLAAHFHNGGASSGLRVASPGPRAVFAEGQRLMRLPGRLTRELRGALSPRPALTGSAAAGARVVPIVATAHTAGELVGLLAGPGRSPDLLD